MNEFTVILDPDGEEGGYTVTVPALPGCITQGDTFDEALAMARDAIAGYLESMAAHGEPIPVDPFGEELAQLGANGTPLRPRASVWKPWGDDQAHVVLAVVRVDIGEVAQPASR